MKGFNVREFRSVIENNGGLKLANKFLVEFPVPPGLKSATDLIPSIGVGGRSDRISFYCKATSIPGLGILTNDVFRFGYGPIERKPYGVVFNDVMLSMYVDGDGRIEDWFHEWARLIVNYRTDKGIMSEHEKTGFNGYEFSYKDQYAVDLTITTFNQEGTKKSTIVLNEAYPNFIGDIMVDWSAKNQLMMLPISVTFRDWYKIRTNPVSINRIEATGTLGEE